MRLVTCPASARAVRPSRLHGMCGTQPVVNPSASAARALASSSSTVVCSPLTSLMNSPMRIGAACHTLPEGSGGGRRGPGSDDVVLGVDVALHLDEATRAGRAHELQERAVPEALLREVGLLLAHLVLQTREVDRTLARQLLDRLAQQRE